jgi:hypothetical protein
MAMPQRKGFPREEDGISKAVPLHASDTQTPSSSSFVLNPQDPGKKIKIIRSSQVTNYEKNPKNSKFLKSHSKSICFNVPCEFFDCCFHPQTNSSLFGLHGIDVASN